MTKTKIYLIHGYTATPDSNWFQDFKTKVENETTEVCVLAMPNSQSPRFDEWIGHMQNCVNSIDENTIFIGHSLGCVTILNFLNDYNQSKIKGLFLISGFVEKSPIVELNEFVVPELNYAHLKTLAPFNLSISAEDDDIVPCEYSKFLAEKLDSKFVLLKEGKHFIDRDNFTEFPYLIEEVKKMLRE